MASQPLDNIDQQFAQLKSELANLQRKYDEIQPENLKSEFATLQSAHRSLVRKVRASGAGVLILSCICLLSNSLPTALAQGYGTTLRSILQRITALETAQKATTANLSSLNNSVASLDTKTKYLTTGVDSNGYPASYFTACNVYIQDGLGSTSGISDDPTLTSALYNELDGAGQMHAVSNGLGNLIIGYNEPSNISAGGYTGSHNLIVGADNHYTSIGAIVSGLGNSGNSPFGSVVGGIGNETTGDLADVYGGYQNVASGFISAVSGGASNTASGIFSTISGGESNGSSGAFSTSLRDTATLHPVRGPVSAAGPF